MPRFDLDAQRGLLCLFGLVALSVEAVAFYLTGKALPDMFTGAFITMAIGPVLTKTAEQYRDARTSRQVEQEEPETAPSSAQSPPDEGGSK